jgi:diguanylate cyclase (GGDEF)-like protein
VLQLGFRGPVELRRREQQVLRTLAHAISSTCRTPGSTARCAHAEAKAYEASHDALTGLGNRSLLQEQAGRTLAADAERGTQTALLIVDLDHFKEINDTLGHATGDTLLTQVGRRIAAAVPQADAVCRLGGDEFAVLLGGFQRAEDADALAAELLRVLAEPAVFDGTRLSVEGSVGSPAPPTTPRPSTSSCSARTSRCTRPRTPGGPSPTTAPSATSRACTAWRWPPSCGRRSPRTSWSCTSSRSTSCAPARSSGRGARALAAPRTRACCRRRSSSRRSSTPD